MARTSDTLLDRLRLESDPESWKTLVDLYTPLIRNWLRRDARLGQEADDLVQDVLCVVVRKLPEFRREPRTGAFRCWLRTITVNCLRDHWRARKNRPLPVADGEFLKMLQQLEDSDSGLSRLWDEEHDLHVASRLLELIKPQFEPKTWRAFERVSLDGVAAEQVARELGVSVNAVFIAKSRVLSRLRRESEGMIDGDRRFV